MKTKKQLKDLLPSRGLTSDWLWVSVSYPCDVNVVKPSHIAYGTTYYFQSSEREISKPNHQFLH